MKKATIFLAINAIAYLFLFSCSTAPTNIPSINTQEEIKKYKNSLHYLVFDKEERLLLASTNGFIIRMDNIEGQNIVTYGEWGLGSGQFRYAYGIAVDSKNRIYIGDQKNQRLVRIDDIEGNGWKTFDFSSGENATLGIRGLCIDKDDRIYITDEARQRIIRMDDIEGNNLVQLGTYGSAEMQFATPVTLDIDSLGRIYIVDHGNNRIVRIDDMNGTGWITYGKDGKGVGELYKPTGIALDAEDHIIIADGNNRFIKLDDMNGSNWQENEIPNQDKQKPVGLAGIKIDKQGRILYLDYNNAMICRIDSINGDGFVSYSFEKE